VKDAFTGRQGKPEVFDLKDTADVKAWLAPFTQSVSNITSSHQYVFERKVVGGEVKAVMSCKQFAACSDDKLVTVGPLLKVRILCPPPAPDGPTQARPVPRRCMRHIAPDGACGT
jgi:hypothetical protein